MTAALLTWIERSISGTSCEMTAYWHLVRLAIW